MKKPAFFISIIICTVILLSVIQVVVSNSLSTTGIELGKLQDQIGGLKTENALLKEKILVSSSLTQIASSAAQTGFMDTKQTVYITTPLPLALKR